jgi:hypothetical protein
MMATLELFKAPVPPDVEITLVMDGRPVAHGTLDRAKLREVMVLEPELLPSTTAGSHTWTITAKPAVAGLGFSLALQSWVPWPKEAAKQGLELSLPPVLAGAVGKPLDVEVKAIAPSGIAVHVQQALPAGVQVDTPSLEALVEAGTIARFAIADGRLDLYVAPLQPGQVFAAKYRVVPTLAGKLKSSASLIEAGAHQFFVPPTEWTIK